MEAYPTSHAIVSINVSVSTLSFHDLSNYTLLLKFSFVV